ncbi:cyclophilin-like fold protein [Sphingomonas melonis]|uniref:cyclophilin-like fold protein n=1 Tax=Sphingomonas melonis TaxID=152682 RepID=UPI0018CB698E
MAVTTDADLPRRLKREAASDAITPKTGDLTSYALRGNLAIFCRDGHRSPTLIHLGHLEGDSEAFASASLVRLSPGSAPARSPAQ